MAFGRPGQIAVFLAVAMACTARGTAHAAETGGSPNDLGMRSADRQRTVLPVIRGVPPKPTVDPGDVSGASSSSDTREAARDGYEASVTLVDAGISALPKDIAARRVAELVGIARSNTVFTRSAATIYREDMTSEPVRMIETSRVKPVRDGITISIRHVEADVARKGAEIVAQETITRCQELDGTPKPRLKMQSPAEVHPVRPAAGPLSLRLRAWFFAPENHLRSWIILTCICILLGALGGRFLGRRHGSIRVYAMLIGLTIVLFAAGIVWRNMELRKPDKYEGYTTLLCDPGASTSTSDEVMGLAKSRVVLERSAGVLAQLGIKAAPDGILARLKTEQIKDTHLISIKVSSADEAEAKATADIVAGKTMEVYRQRHAGGASAARVQLVDPARTAPMDVHRAAQLILIFGIPVGVGFIAFLTAYPIAARRAGKRKRKAL